MNNGVKETMPDQDWAIGIEGDLATIAAVRHPIASDRTYIA